MATVVAGLGWLGLSFLLAYLQLPPLPEVHWRGLPAPTVLAIGGVLAGLAAGRAGQDWCGGGRPAAYGKARQSLRAAIARVTGELVIEPVKAEQAQYESARLALERAEASSRSVRHAP